jgi:hypothetical protein
MTIDAGRALPGINPIGGWTAAGAADEISLIGSEWGGHPLAAPVFSRQEERLPVPHDYPVT